MARRSKTTATFTVSVVLPTGTTCKDAQEYMEEALAAWGGGRASDDPFFKAPPFTVTLTSKSTTYV
jgi:hypothetical protein